MMKKKSKIMLLGIIMILAACSIEEKIVKDTENNGEKEVIDLPKDVNMITVTGNGLAIFPETEDQLKDRKVIFEQAEEIEVILKAIKVSSPHSGPMTSEGENFEIILSYKDDTSDTILLWLYPDRNSGRLQKDNYNGPIYLLSKEDVHSIAKLLDEKIPQ
jgi:hypothetical protein